jgi:hypothetical protein
MKGEQNNYFGDMPMGIVIFMIGMIVGCFVGAFLIALIVTGHNSDDEIPDDTDSEE